MFLVHPVGAEADLHAVGGALAVDDEEMAEDIQLVVPTSCAGAVNSL